MHSNVAQTQYVIVEFVVFEDSCLFLGEEFNQSVATPIGTLVFRGSDHFIVGHCDVAVGSNGFEMNTKGVEQLINGLTLKHIANEQGALLKFVAVLLIKGNYATGLLVFVINVDLVAVARRERTKGKAAKTCANNRYLHCAFSSLEARAALFSAS